MTAHQTWTFDQYIASDCNVGNRIVLEIVKQLQEIGWTESEVFGIHMALEEAIINAIKHGNREADDKQVHVVVEATPDSFYLCVTDQGAGFDPQAVPDCTADDNLELCSGRGLMLMKHFMDEVNYNEVGNSLEIRKSRQASESRGGTSPPRPDLSV